jgi:hypothetical protein
LESLSKDCLNRLIFASFAKSPSGDKNVSIIVDSNILFIIGNWIIRISIFQICYGRYKIQHKIVRLSKIMKH